MKRKPKSETVAIQEAIWQLCKQIIRYRDGSTCYTCGAVDLVGSNQQTGHFIAASICGAYLKYDLRNLRVQCMRCNVRLSGNGAVFYDNLRRDFGQGYVDDLFRDKQRSTKAIEHYRAILPLYKKLYQNIFSIKRKDLYSPCEFLENLAKNFPPESELL